MARSEIRTRNLKVTSPIDHTYTYNLSKVGLLDFRPFDSDPLTIQLISLDHKGPS